MDQALDDLREEIESIDCGLLRLWEKRMYTAVKVGVYKRN
ncbi:MAG: chorismate mutase, partial [Firmicutes bacterium]|nr:chorismate mutase [Bacillota bacterium]